MDSNDLLIVAGKGLYPRELLAGARAAGVSRIGVLAFRGQTDRSLCAAADVSARFGIGEFSRVHAWVNASGFHNAIFAGQISPLALFATRFDAEARRLLSELKSKSAHSIFGAIIRVFEADGMRFIPASSYMDHCLPAPGVLTARAPDTRERADFARGFEATAALGTVDVGQTAVVKDGMVLAVEAFEGTNAAIKRGASLGGRGAVVVKAARGGHDMRFDIPVIGPGTIRRLARSRVSALAVQAGRTIILGRDETVARANRHGIAIEAFDSGLPPAPTRP